MLKRDTWALIVSLCLLGGAAVDGWSVRPPPDAEGYHARCRAAAATIPVEIGEWTGRDVEVSRDAINLLRPNVVLQRNFTHVVTGNHVSLLFVQCGDARDMSSHYPPICYPTTRGMELASSRPRDWHVRGRTISGTEYEFRKANFRSADRLIVQNFILLPGGVIARDMEPVKKQIPLRNRYFGAGQVQLVFSASVPAEVRDAAFEEVVAGFQPLLEAVLSGSGHE